jgi:hypothetical protein
MSRRAEVLALVLGLLLLTLAAATYDWRLGLAVAGALLIVSAVDFRGVRR